MKPDFSKETLFQPDCLFLIAAGAFGLWLGFPNSLIQLPPLVAIWPVALLLLGRRARTCKQAILYGWLCAFCGMLAVMYWLALPVHNVGNLPWIGAIFCAMLICAALALHGAFFSCLAYYCPCWNPGVFSATLALAWYLLELSFAWLFGFPWTPLAGALMGWPWLAQGASIFGAYALSSVWLFPLFLLLFALPQIRAYAGLLSKTSRKSCIAMAVIAFVIFCVLSAYGAYQLERKMPGNQESIFNVLMVEGNIDQNQKWDPAFQRESLEIYMKLTLAGLADNYAQGDKPLVIWPETVLPFFLQRHARFQGELSAFVKGMGCPLLFGAPAIETVAGHDEEIFNRAFLMDGEGKYLGSYDKVHLVPFGEYAPEWLKLDFLEALLQGVGIYSAGNSSEPLLIGRLALGMLICYEGIFPWMAQERVEAGANVLVDISNDGWFGDSPAARQHLDLTLLRCIEQNRWLARSTNTGISVIADAAGQVKVAGPLFHAGFVSGAVQTQTDYTVFYRFGKWYPVLVLAIFLLLWLSPFFKRMEQKRSQC